MKGCISYNLYAITEYNEVLIMLEEWKDIDALNEHMQTNHFKKFGTTIEHLLAKEIEINSYSVAPV